MVWLWESLAIRFALLLISAICATLPAYGQPASPATVPVGVVKAEKKAVSKTADFVGRVEAFNRVQINARVKGFLEEVLFKEGDIVKDGAPLYRIEQGLFKASVEQAQGALERAKAAKTLTEIQLQRAQELMTRQAGTVVARDQALSPALGVRASPASPASCSASSRSPSRSRCSFPPSTR